MPRSSTSWFSRSNPFYMRQVFETWRGADETVQQLVGRIPWGHHLVLLTKERDPEARAFYASDAQGAPAPAALGVWLLRPRRAPRTGGSGRGAARRGRS